jgi:hypothetical protein
MLEKERALTVEEGAHIASTPHKIFTSSDNKVRELATACLPW